MKHSLHFFYTLALVALSALVFMGCNPTVGPVNDTGKIQISLANNINARTLAPSINMNVASYTVTGTGPGNATFTATSAGEPISKAGLVIGDWTIVVNASNSSAELIGTGTANAQVNSGENTNVSVSVAPIAGSGTLSLNISWLAFQVQNPSIVASLTPALGAAQVMNFNVDGANASYLNAAVPTGYYTFAFTLLDDGIAVTGAAEVVRIVDGQVTSGSFAIDNGDLAPGSLTVTINANLQNPLLVSIAGAQATLSMGNTQTLTASVSNYSDSVVYEWFVNGAIQVSTGASFVFGSGLAIGDFRIDVTSYNADRSRAGSAKQDVKVIAASTVVNPAAVNLGTAGDFAILAKTAISTVPLSAITGDIGISPAAESFMTGFSQTKATGYSTSTQVVGFMFAADSTAPTPAKMTTAISDMETAYTDAAGRVTPDYLDLGTGAIGGSILLPGLYKWNTSVSILSDVTISGSADDIWIFQISGDLGEAASKNVILAGGAQAKNIVWQVAGTVTVGTAAHFEGIVLGKTSVTLMTGATMNGRVLAQTNVALDQASVTEPSL